MKTTCKNLGLLAVIAVFLISTNITTKAQASHTGYFIKTLPTRTDMNPALQPENGYIGFPFLSNITTSAVTNTFNLDHFLFPGQYPKPLTFMHHDVSVEEFMKNISNDNYLSVDADFTLFSAGWRKGNGFWFFDITSRTHVEGNVPKSLFEFAKVGFSATEERSYNMKDTRIIGDSHVQLGLGHSRSFLDNDLTVGVKGKVLLGIGNVDANIKDLYVSGGPGGWTARSSAKLSGSAPGIYAKYDSKDKFETLDIDGFTISGYGLGVDLGGVYKLNTVANLIPVSWLSDFVSNLNVSMSLTDIGFISWSKKNSIEMESPESTVEIPSTESSLNDGDALIDQFDDVVDDLLEALNFQEVEGGSKSRSTSLRTTMNWGLEYEIIQNKISLGLLSSTYFNRSHTQTEFTFSGNFAPVKWFATSLSYSFVHGNFDTFGLAVHLAPSKGLNLFIASDYLIPHVNSDWIPTTSKAVNVQFGLSIPM